MKTLEVNCYGNKFDVWFYTNTYANNGTMYIGAMCKDEDGNVDYYGDVSVNLSHGRVDNDNEFYADINNSKELIKTMLEAKLIEDLDETCSSGYCIYPKMKITEKFKEYIEESEV